MEYLQSLTQGGEGRASCHTRTSNSSGNPAEIVSYHDPTRLLDAATNPPLGYNEYGRGDDNLGLPPAPFRRPVTDPGNRSSILARQAEAASSHSGNQSAWCQQDAKDVKSDLQFIDPFAAGWGETYPDVSELARDTQVEDLAQPAWQSSDVGGNSYTSRRYNFHGHHQSAARASINTKNSVRESPSNPRPTAAISTLTLPPIPIDPRLEDTPPTPLRIIQYNERDPNKADKRLDGPEDSERKKQIRERFGACYTCSKDKRQCDGEEVCQRCEDKGLKCVRPSPTPESSIRTQGASAGVHCPEGLALNLAQREGPMASLNRPMTSAPSLSHFRVPPRRIFDRADADIIALDPSTAPTPISWKDPLPRDATASSEGNCPSLSKTGQTHESSSINEPVFSRRLSYPGFSQPSMDVGVSSNSSYSMGEQLGPGQAKLRPAPQLTFADLTGGSGIDDASLVPFFDFDGYSRKHPDIE